MAYLPIVISAVARDNKTNHIDSDIARIQMTPENSTITNKTPRPASPEEKKPKRWPIWLGALIILLAGGGYLLSQRATNTTATNGGKNVRRRAPKAAGPCRSRAIRY